MQKPITDLDIQALVDNELDEEEKQRVTKFIRSNHGARERYEELKLQKTLLNQWWQGSVH